LQEWSFPKEKEQVYRIVKEQNMRAFFAAKRLKSIARGGTGLPVYRRVLLSRPIDTPMPLVMRSASCRSNQGRELNRIVQGIQYWENSTARENNTAMGDQLDCIGDY
jgi:beta-xylosidase